MKRTNEMKHRPRIFSNPGIRGVADSNPVIPAITSMRKGPDTPLNTSPKHEQDIILFVVNPLEAGPVLL